MMKSISIFLGEPRFPLRPPPFPPLEKVEPKKTIVSSTLPLEKVKPKTVFGSTLPLEKVKPKTVFGSTFFKGGKGG